MQCQGNLAAKEGGLECARMNHDNFIVLVSVGRCRWVSTCTAWLSHSNCLSEYSNGSTPSFTLSLNIPPQKWFGQLRRLQFWASGDSHLHHDNAHSCIIYPAEFLVKHQIIQVTQPPFSPDWAPCDFQLFPKLKSPLKGKRFQTVNEIQENVMGQLMAIGRTVWGPKVLTLKGTEASLFHVQCFLYPIPSSKKRSVVFILHGCMPSGNLCAHKSAWMYKHTSRHI